MDVFTNINKIPKINGSVLTIGSFDGLHLGHQEVIKKVVAYSNALKIPSVVVTFEPHPKMILSKKKNFDILMNINDKISLLEKFGIDATFVIPFNSKFSTTPAKLFLKSIIIEKFHPTKIIIGYDHHFGFKRKGDRKLLESESGKYGYLIEVVSKVGHKEKIYSSSSIRRLIKNGEVKRASYDLGRAYGFEVTVVSGSGRGFDLNFPTANFIPRFESQLIPFSGVYFTRGKINGKWLYGMANLGTRPTFKEKNFTMEMNFFDVELDIVSDNYFQIQFLERIRDEKNFNSSKDLVKQLIKDKMYCLKRINTYK
tara:strand:+ start:6642 stop:7577 length:936 start_codon:yes stop_codon:yes gene_type:complete